MDPVTAWWGLLTGIACFNLGAWAVLARRHVRLGWPAGTTAFALATAFTWGCAFRSILPRVDGARIVLVDSWLSSVVLGRSVATVAELAFMALLALVLRETAREAGAPGVVRLSYLIVPMIAFAECWSWYGILSTNNLGHVIEESTWALAAALLIAGVAAMWGKLLPKARRMAGACALLGVGYVAFMVTVDVPMYHARWVAEEAAGKAYMPLAAGLMDVATRWRVDFGYAVWRPEMPWMTLYFSISVWASLLLARPRSRT